MQYNGTRHTFISLSPLLISEYALEGQVHGECIYLQALLVLGVDIHLEGLQLQLAPLQERCKHILKIIEKERKEKVKQEVVGKIIHHKVVS